MTRKWPARLFASACCFAAVVVGVKLWMQAPTWTATPTAPIAQSAGIAFRQFVAEDSSTSFTVRCVTFQEGTATLSLVDLPDGLTRSLATLCDDAGAVAAINGGYFDHDFQPIGAIQIDGKRISNYTEKSPLSGSVNVYAQGQIRLSYANGDKVNAESFLQCGPMLINPGGKRGILSDDGRMAERTVVATHRGRVAILTTTPVTLYALSDFLLEVPDALGLDGVDCAVNLDGGPSTGMVVRVGEAQFETEPRGRIRNALLLSKRDGNR